MSQPKKKTSRSRRDLRRYAIGKAPKAITLTKCPSCSEPVRPHRVCKCGQYKGKPVIETVASA